MSGVEKPLPEDDKAIRILEAARREALEEAVENVRDIENAGEARSRWAWGPVVSVFAALCIVVAIAAAPRFGVAVPAVFGAGQAVLHGAVIIALSILGAAILAVGFHFVLSEWRSLGAAEEALRAAEKDLARAKSSLKRAGELSHSLRGLKESGLEDTATAT